MEINVVKPTESLSCIDLVKVIGKDIEMDTEETEIFLQHIRYPDFMRQRKWNMLRKGILIAGGKK